MTFSEDIKMANNRCPYNDNINKLLVKQKQFS